MEPGKFPYVSEVIRVFFSGRYSKATEEEVQLWLLDEARREEKEEALENFWNGLEVQVSDRARGSLKEVKDKLGIRPRKRSIWNARTMGRIAAVLIPCAILAGALMTYQNVKEPEMITIAATEMVKEILPDGSEVSLNKGSSLTYPSKFKKRERIVTLSGEALFSVVHEHDRTFEVRTEELTVTVLGTIFNIRAYPDEQNTTVTLVEGSVQVDTGDGQPIVLLQNQQLVMDNGSKETKILEVNAENAASWTKGDLVFENASLEEIFNTLERNTGLKFDVDGRLNMSDRYSVKFTHGEDIGIILAVIRALSGNFEYEMVNSTVFITGN